MQCRDWTNGRSNLIELCWGNHITYFTAPHPLWAWIQWIWASDRASPGFSGPASAPAPRTFSDCDCPLQLTDACDMSHSLGVLIAWKGKSGCLHTTYMCTLVRGIRCNCGLSSTLRLIPAWSVPFAKLGRCNHMEGAGSAVRSIPISNPSMLPRYLSNLLILPRSRISGVCHVDYNVHTMPGLI